MIKFENVSLEFPEQKICKKLSFHLLAGKSLCLSGESGKGKTSLLKLLMGVIQPDSGRITVDGLELNPDNLVQIRKQMTWLPQNVNLPVNSGNELASLLNLTEKNKKLYSEYLDRLGISDLERERTFSELSGGQKQRMVLAACLSLDRSILILDEPVSALDEHSIEVFINVIQSLIGKTIVSTSHNKRWLEICSEIIEL